MARSGSSSLVSTSRWLVGVIAGVVLCFVLATAVGERMASTIADRASDISGNAMPSVQMLTSARGDLRALERDVDRYPLLPAEQRPALRDKISGTRHNVEASLAAYVALPFFPNERELYAHLEDALARLDARLAPLLGPGDPLDPAALQGNFDLVDEAIERVVSFDAAQGARLGLAIQRTRDQARGTMILLDAASVLLAIGAAYLAIRQLRRTEQARKAELDALEGRELELSAQNEALGQFAGHVAHDVLSPLSTAMLAFELVGHQCGDNPAVRRSTQQGMAAITRAGTLVDGLLAFSRAGGFPEPGVSTEVGPVIADVVEALSGQAREQRIDLTVSASAPARAAVVCSKGVLTSLLSNLLRNAIKYMGDAPRRVIDVRALDAGGRWRIEVEDTGPGIAEAQQERIFRPHVQLGQTAGIGLGLATVDRLIRGHAGALGVISSPGRGSVFWFELPKPDATPAEDEARCTTLEQHAAT